MRKAGTGGRVYLVYSSVMDLVCQRWAKKVHHCWVFGEFEISV